MDEEEEAFYGERDRERRERRQREEEEEDEEEFEEEYGEAEPPPPPLPDEEKELLFLIEFLVDTLTLNPKNLNTEKLDPCTLQGPVSIALTFLHFPPMVLSELDANSDKQTGCDVIEFNSGRSLMFALTESQFEDPPPVFLGITITKDMPHAFRFSQLMIGKTKIELSELFKQVFDKYDENPSRTVSKSVKDTYQVVGDDDKITGKVSIYIRLTCMGENIVTEFQKGEDPTETLLFKNDESRKVYECKESEVEDHSSGLRMPGWGGGKAGKETSVCEEELPEPPPDPDDENFEQIFAQINGSAMTIKVEKGTRKEKPKQYHVSDFCDCDIPLPQDLVAGMSDSTFNPDSEEVMSAGTAAPVKNVTTDKRVGKDDANQLLFRAPSVNEIARPRFDGKPNSVNYTVKTCPDGDVHGHKNDAFKVLANDNLEGNPSPLPNDPDKDVFVLRIIKRAKKEKGKNILELEFKTPKEKIVPPKKPPYLLDAGVGPEKSKKETAKKKK